MNKDIAKQLVNVKIRVHRGTEDAEGTVEGEVKVNHGPQDVKSCHVE